MTELTASTHVTLDKVIGKGLVTEEMARGLIENANNPFLVPLFSNVHIGTTTGDLTIYMATETFAWPIDTDFVHCRTNFASRPTPHACVKVYEMCPERCTSAKLSEMLRSLGDLHEIALTQHQIIDYCERNHALLPEDGRRTLFPFSVGCGVWAASVQWNKVWDKDKPMVKLCAPAATRLRASNRHRIVVKQML